MPSSTEPREPVPSGRSHLLVGILCVVAVLHVLFGAAALPFFTNVDEEEHFDLVHKLSRGHWPPQGCERIDEETARQYAIHASLEFYNQPSDFRGGKVPAPIWTWPAGAARDRIIRARVAGRLHEVNHEATSPPLYYVLAGAWYDLGKVLGVPMSQRVFWVRSLNAVFLTGLLLLAYRFAMRTFSPFVAGSTALLLALFPNTILLSINCDNLVPLIFSAALFLALRWRDQDQPGSGIAVSVGLLTAASILTKLTSLPLIPVVALVAWQKARRVPAAGRRRALVEAALLGMGAALPVLGWMAVNRSVLGDWLGTQAKVHQLGWSARPLAQVMDHPLFSPRGMAVFLDGLARTFWRGSLEWHGQVFSSEPSDTYYVCSSLVFPAAAGVSCLRRRKQPGCTADVTGVLLLTVCLTILYLMALSLPYDYGECVFPSREHPYMNDGRLLAGVLVPFLLLFARGIECVSGGVRGVRLGLLGLTVVMMVLSQRDLFRMVLPSAYNWFHL